jgi:uncharacterized protein
MAQNKLALITGASAGIGSEFAKQLSSLCDRMILVGRRMEKLQELSEQLQGVSCQLLAVDLESDDGIAEVVRAIAAAEPLDYLVNNAGFTIIGPFDSLNLETQMGMVQVHIKATMSLVHAALPAMKRANKGAIINVSSMCTFTPYVDVAVYGGTKAFLHNYSGALNDELKDTGIGVQCLVPGFTHTELHDREAFDNYETPEVPAHMWMTAEDVVAESLAELSSGRVVVVAGDVNKASAREALQYQLDQLNN